MAPKRMLENREPEIEERVVVSASAREKRPRVPRFTDVIRDALRLQNFQTILEPLLRRVVCEEIQRALERRIPPNIMPAAKQIQGSEARNLRLQFKNKLSLPLFTGSRVEGDQGSSIQILLLDASTGKRVTSGPESLQKVEIVVLEGDFGHDDDEEWTEAEFENYVVREREGKRPLLTGELIVSLKDGLGSLGELSFTDNSSWLRSRKFRLGARVSGVNYGGIRIREARTEAFTVKDHRGELYKKHYPPALHDEVWRLEKVGKDGAFHKRLSSERIKTVQDFLRALVMDPHQLRQILGNGMSHKMWEVTVEHAKMCVLNKKRYVYHHADRHSDCHIIFNVICEPVGIVADDQIVPLDKISETNKTIVKRLVKSAYEHWDWNQVIEYEEELLISNASHSLALKNTPIEASEVHVDPSYQRAVLVSEQDGQGAHMIGSRFMGHQQSMKHATGDWPYSDGSVNMAASNQVSMTTGFVQQSMATQPMESPSLALGPRQTHMYSNPMSFHTTNLNSFIYRNGPRNQHADKVFREVNRNDWASEPHEGPSSFYHSNSSNDLLTNCRGPDAEDWIPNINSAAVEQGYNFFPNTPADQVFPFPSFSPTDNMGFNMSGDRFHGKAYLGWLKIKAALKWGISVRKVAAAKRAKLEELED